MTDRLKTRWMLVGISWIAAILLSIWNLDTIDSIVTANEKKEIYRIDEQFWNYNAANISHILKKSASLVQEVESSKLGFFEFEGHIRKLAVKSELEAIKLTSPSQVEQTGMIPVKISFRSTFRHAMQWFDGLAAELPYAQVREVSIESAQSTKQSKFEVSMYYRYNQTAQGNTY